MFFNIIEYNGGFTHTDGYMSAEQIIDVYGNLMPRNYTITSGDYPVRYTNFFEDITDRTQLVGVTSHTINYDVKEIGLVDENSLNEAISNSVADWNQNDENASNYVKNRTHYEATETQTVTGTAFGEISQFDYYWYKYQDMAIDVNYMVKSNRSNYAINGEPAKLITIPAMIENNNAETVNYPETTGLESASWRMAYYPNDSYSGLIWYCKDSNIYDSSLYLLNMTVTYDEEVEVPVVHQLDEKYIPDTIARTSIIKDLSNALKGNKSGAAVACDVSPIEHTLKVKARRKNLFDISKIQNITQSDTQKIIQNNDGTLTIYGTAVNSQKTLRELCPSLKVGDEVMMSFRLVNSGTDTKKYGYIYMSGADMTWTSETAKVMTDNILDSFVLFYCRYYAQQGPENINMGTISEFQIELGTTKTPYTPYIADLSTAKVIVNGSQTYPINADGTVEGITSLYPTTTLTTDTEGIVLDVEYNRDINSAFAELTQAIISLGGNI